MPGEEVNAVTKSKAEARAEKKAQKAARVKKAMMKDQTVPQAGLQGTGTDNLANTVQKTKPGTSSVETSLNSSGIQSSAQNTQNTTQKTTSKSQNQNIPLKTPDNIHKTSQNTTQSTTSKSQIQNVASKTPDIVQKTAQKPLKDAPSAKVTQSKSSKVVVQQRPAKLKVPVQQSVKLFERLSSVKKSSVEPIPQNFPPSMARLAVQFADGVIVGSNARCMAFMEAARQLIEDYKTPPEKTFSRGLEETLQTCSEFLFQYRPVSISIRNALKFLKWQVLHLPDEPEDKCKTRLYKAIESYTWEQIELADRAISSTVKQKIVNGDVVVVYGCSSIVQRIIQDAHGEGTNFRLIVVDGWPWKEGKEMLRRMVGAGVKCSYVLVTAASFAMMEATKVLLGAHSLLTNGSAIVRAGTSQVAMLAHARNVPVLVCCETHKFSEGAHTDAFCREELVVGSDTSAIVYDIMPPDFVTAVVTEVAVVPCTSVPVILRISA